MSVLKKEGEMNKKYDDEGGDREGENIIIITNRECNYIIIKKY